MLAGATNTALFTGLVIATEGGAFVTVISNCTWFDDASRELILMNEAEFVWQCTPRHTRFLPAAFSEVTKVVTSIVYQASVVPLTVTLFSELLSAGRLLQVIDVSPQFVFATE